MSTDKDKLIENDKQVEENDKYQQYKDKLQDLNNTANELYKKYDIDSDKDWLISEAVGSFVFTSTYILSYGAGEAQHFVITIGLLIQYLFSYKHCNMAYYLSLFITQPDKMDLLKFIKHAIVQGIGCLASCFILNFIRLVDYDDYYEYRLSCTILTTAIWVILLNLLLEQPNISYYKTVILIVAGYHFLRIHPKNLMNPLIELTTSAFLALINFDLSYLHLIMAAGQLGGALAGSLAYKYWIKGFDIQKKFCDQSDQKANDQ